MLLPNLIIAVIKIIFVILANLPLTQFLIFISYFDNFTFNVDTIIFVDITSIETPLSGRDKWRYRNSRIVALHSIAKQQITLELYCLLVIILFCFFIFKFYYKLTFKVTLQKIIKLHRLIWPFVLMSVIVIMIRCCIYNYDVDGYPSRLRNGLFNSRIVIDFFQNMSSWTLMCILMCFGFVIALRCFVGNKTWIEEDLRPITIYMLLSSILVKIFSCIFVIIRVLIIPHTIYDLRVESWYSFDDHLLGAKDTLPFLYEDEYWNFEKNYVPFLLTDLYVIIAELMEVWVWTLLFIKIWKLFKQWQKLYPYLLDIDNDLLLDVPEKRQLDKKTNRLEGDWFGSKKIDEMFAIQILHVFFNFVLCIIFNIFLLIISEDMGFLATNSISYGISSNYDSLLAQARLELSYGSTPADREIFFQEIEKNENYY